MSLVNDMLRDLDRRKATDQPTSHESGSGPVAPFSRRAIPLPRLLGLIVLVVMVAAGYFFYGLYSRYEQRLERQQTRNSEAQALLEPAAVEVKTQPDNPPGVLIEDLAVSELNSGARIEIRLSAELVHRVVAVGEREIAVNLPGAQLTRLLPQLTDGRLITAINVARSEHGLTFSVKLSRQVTFQTYLLNQDELVWLIIDLVPLEQDKPVDEPVLEERIEELEAELPTGVKVAESVDEATALPSQQEAARQPLASKTAEEPVAVRESVSSANVNKTSPVLSPQEKDHQISRLAAEQVRTGQVKGAIDQLQGFLGVNPEALQARSLLARLQIQQGEYVAAETLLEKGLALAPDYEPFVLLAARALMGQSRNGEALAWLQQQSPQLQVKIEFQALLAPLLQRENKHKEAVRVYRRLLAQDANNAQWWIGQAISLEAAGEFQQALQAYLSATRVPEIDARLMAYATRRVAQLRKTR